MGGINHQLSRRYLKQTTQLSLCLSEGTVQLESANVAFEDLILKEINGAPGDFTAITRHLAGAAAAMTEFIDCLDGLVAHMRDSRYKDLLPMHQLDLDAIGADFVEQGVVKEVAWDVVVRIVRNGGFYAALAHFRERAETLRRLFSELLAAFEALSNLAEKGELARVLKDNRRGNVRPAYARAYAAWYKFHSEFLASSLLSAEVWYAFHGYESMVAEPWFLSCAA